jgi:hypothetical protein
MLECDLLLEKGNDPNQPTPEENQLNERREEAIGKISTSVFQNLVALQFKEFKSWAVMQPQITEFLEYVLRRWIYYYFSFTNTQDLENMTLSVISPIF